MFLFRVERFTLGFIMKALTWASPNIVRLEEQAKVSMFGDHPIEMGTKDQEDKVILFLQLSKLIS